ncbi:hypothetical protein QTP88_012447 [Uroleucon formosanum]
MSQNTIKLKKNNTATIKLIKNIEYLTPIDTQFRLFEGCVEAHTRARHPRTMTVRLVDGGVGFSLRFPESPPPPPRLPDAIFPFLGCRFMKSYNNIIIISLRTVKWPRPSLRDGSRPRAHATERCGHVVDRPVQWDGWVGDRAAPRGRAARRLHARGGGRPVGRWA